MAEVTGRTAYGGGRMTRQRAIVAQSVEGSPGAFTVDELAARARRSSPALGTATVYRAVSTMLNSGFIEHVGDRGGTALYARCGTTGHHHHLVCTECGAVSHAECPVGERTLARASAEGFTVTAHEVRLYGTCAECSRGQPGSE